MGGGGEAEVVAHRDSTVLTLDRHWSAVVTIGRYRESINSEQVINFHVIIVSRISRRSVYFENDFRANLEYIEVRKTSLQNLQTLKLYFLNT